MNEGIKRNDGERKSKEITEKKKKSRKGGGHKIKWRGSKKRKSLKERERKDK